MKKIVLLSLVMITCGLQASDCDGLESSGNSNKLKRAATGWLTSLNSATRKAVPSALICNAAYQLHNGGLQSSGFKTMAGAAAVAGVLSCYKNGEIVGLRDMSVSLLKFKNLVITGAVAGTIYYFNNNTSIPSQWKMVGLGALAMSPLFSGSTK